MTTSAKPQILKDTPMGGRPKINFEKMKVDMWGALEMLCRWETMEDVARIIGVSSDTLGRRINEEYGFGFAEYKARCRSEIRVNIQEKQYMVGMEGDSSMLKWIGIQHCDQTNKNEVKNDVEITNLKFVDEPEKEDGDV